MRLGSSELERHWVTREQVDERGGPGEGELEGIELLELRSLLGSMLGRALSDCSPGGRRPGGEARQRAPTRLGCARARSLPHGAGARAAGRAAGARGRLARRAGPRRDFAARQQPALERTHRGLARRYAHELLPRHRLQRAQVIDEPPHDDDEPLELAARPRKAASVDVTAQRTQLNDHLLEPELVRLMHDDERHLIVHGGLGQRILLRQQARQLQIIEVFATAAPLAFTSVPGSGLPWLGSPLDIGRSDDENGGSAVPGATLGQTSRPRERDAQRPSLQLTRGRVSGMHRPS